MDAEKHRDGCCCDACNPEYHPQDCPGGCGGYGRVDPESYPAGQRPPHPCDGKPLWPPEGMGARTRPKRPETTP